MADQQLKQAVPIHGGAGGSRQGSFSHRFILSRDISPYAPKGPDMTVHPCHILFGSNDSLSRPLKWIIYRQSRP